MPEMSWSRKIDYKDLYDMLNYPFSPQTVELAGRPLKPPTALLVVGANNDDKQRFIKGFIAGLRDWRPRSIQLKGGDTVEECLSEKTFARLPEMNFASTRILLVDVARDISHHENVRSVVIRRLREVGAETVITVWIDYPDWDAASKFAAQRLGLPRTNLLIPDSVFCDLRAKPPAFSDGADFIVRYQPYQL